MNGPLVYAIGVATGIALMLVNKVAIDAAVKNSETRLNKKIASLESDKTRLMDELSKARGDAGFDDGYDRGYADGVRRGKNMTQAEKLEDALSDGGRRKLRMGGS